jgi:HK97 family phage prohead protease
MHKEERQMSKNDTPKEIRIAECRAAAPEQDQDGAMVIEGYAIKFNSPATHYGFTETVDPIALSGTDMRDVPLKYNHMDSVLIMARTRNGSLTLTVDEVGLFIRATLIDTQSNRDAYKAIQAGLLDKMSFAFTVGRDDWDYSLNTRRILAIDKLFDVSVVDTPFYDSTSIYARALQQLESGKRALESGKPEQVQLERIRNRNLLKL